MHEVAFAILHVGIMNSELEDDGSAMAWRVDRTVNGLVEKIICYHFLIYLFMIWFT